MTYYNDKHAVITGAASGIGRALALQLNEQGCALWLSDVNEEGLAETRALLPRRDLACDTRIVDVADRSAVEDWALDIAKHTEAVHLVINNAGVGLLARAQDADYDDFHWLMNINFWGVVHGCRAFLPLLEKAPASHLVNMSSVFGLIGVPTQSTYNASKFAVLFHDSLSSVISYLRPSPRTCSEVFVHCQASAVVDVKHEIYKNCRTVFWLVFMTVM